MNRQFFILCCFFTVMIISSCQSEYEGVVVSDELIPFYESFREEAAKRGVVFENADAQIEGYLQDIAQAGVLGACKRNEDNEDNPQIFLDKPTWDRSTELEKEHVMYHELGHCFLKLSHDDAIDSIGDCSSIMASGISGCRNNYNAANRERLLDELFSK